MNIDKRANRGEIKPYYSDILIECAKSLTHTSPFHYKNAVFFKLTNYNLCFYYKYYVYFQ